MAHDLNPPAPRFVPVLAHAPTPLPRPIPDLKGRIIMLPDPGAIAIVVDALRKASGITNRNLAMAMGVRMGGIHKYFGKGRSRKPGLEWFIRFATACGAKVVVEFPDGTLA